ncbi:MAG: hypothetical protein Q4F05_15700 [bacterium]|nr:hypothetical protein [bacterium]
MKFIYWISSAVYYVLTGVLVYEYQNGYEGWIVAVVAVPWLLALLWTINPIYALYRKLNHINSWSLADIFLKSVTIAFLLSFLDAFGRERIAIAAGIMVLCSVVNIVVNIRNYKLFVQNGISRKEACGKNELRSVESPHYFRYYLYTMWCFSIYQAEAGNLKGLLRDSMILMIVLIFVYRKLQERYGNPRVVYKATVAFIGIYIIGTLFNYYNIMDGIQLLAYVVCELGVVYLIDKLEEKRDAKCL